MTPKITFDLRVKASFVLIWSVPLIPEFACIFRLMSYELYIFLLKLSPVRLRPAHRPICIWKPIQGLCVQSTTSEKWHWWMQRCVVHVDCLWAERVSFGRMFAKQHQDATEIMTENVRRRQSASAKKSARHKWTLQSVKCLKYGH